jgi:hypothetical protein
MRLVIPLVIREVGVEGIIRFIESAASEWRLSEELGWAKGMAPFIVKWASASIEKYNADRPM